MIHTLNFIFYRELTEDQHRSFKAWSNLLAPGVFEKYPMWGNLITINHERIIPSDMYDAYLTFMSNTKDFKY